MIKVPSPLRRKQIVQQLLVGDLADLADEGLHQLLPSGTEKLHAGKKRNQKNKQSETLAKSKQHKQYPSLLNDQNNQLVLAKDALCYVSIEQRLLQQLRQSHTTTRLAKALRDTVFPQLNLKSYLDCKSDLALPTIRHILSGRPPTDEAFELDRSLTQAMVNRKNSRAFKQTVPVKNNGGVNPASAPSKPHGKGYPHPWLLPMEWED